MSIPDRLRRVARGLDLLFGGTLAAAMGFQVWFFSGSGIWLSALGVLAVLQLVAGYLHFCWAPSWEIRLAAWVALAFLVGVVALNLLFPLELAATYSGLRAINYALPVYSLFVCVMAVSEYCRRLDSSTPLAFDLCWKAFLLSGTAAFLAAGNGWYDDMSGIRGSGLWLVSLIAVLALLGTIGSAEIMARRMADKQGLKAPNPEQIPQKVRESGLPVDQPVSRTAITATMQRTPIPQECYLCGKPLEPDEITSRVCAECRGST